MEILTLYFYCGLIGSTAPTVLIGAKLFDISYKWRHVSVVA